MSGARPEQAALTRDTDLGKTEDTRRVIEGMVDGLNDHRIDDIGAFFADGFRWTGNAGCGTKNGLKEFQDNWQRPFQAAFSDKVCIDEARLFMGEWAAAFGRQDAHDVYAGGLAQLLEHVGDHGRVGRGVGRQRAAAALLWLQRRCAGEVHGRHELAARLRPDLPQR